MSITDLAVHGSGGDARTIDIAVDVDVDRAVLVRIPCNEAKDRVPGGVIRTSGLESEVVWDVWYRR